MSIPTLEKTWQFNVNQVVGGIGGATDSKDTLRKFKNALIGFGTLPWTVVGSSNGTTAGLDAVDRWSTNADLVIANPGVAHSWIVLKQTGIATNCQMLISYGVASTTGAFIRVAVSINAGFTGGSITADPTATDAFWAGSATAADVNWCDTAFTGRLSVMQSTDGQCTRMFMYETNVVHAFFMIDKPKLSLSSGWAQPVMMYVNATLPNPVGNAVLDTYLSPQYFKMKITQEGDAVNTIGSNSSFGANEIDGNYPILPLGLFSATTVGYRGRHGTIYDLWGGATSLGTGSLYPGDASKQFLQLGVGQLIVPWNGSTPITA